MTRYPFGEQKSPWDQPDIDAEGPLGAWVLLAFVVWAIILGVGFVLWGPL